MPRSAWLRRVARRLRKDDGDASLEALMIFPAALLIALLLAEAGNIYYAKTLATTAAREAIAGARGYGSSTDEGLARADALFARAPDSLLSPRVSVTSGAERIEFTVTGKAQSVLGLNITVREHATGPVERWSNP
ncbi:pilus assembly protein [Streptomyces sp. NBC_01433]|uniref:TadE/TadG family type IV pilus assembly protein n=1 Tax=Streptomyces sp. NBC_01433 TaxID=2903864 RepID=UPI0022516D57|nr:TadE/TadG family type IV pilus assembly protein [Streptomyces sp. NBC_01433]MCX4682246.1 pilus assembly protein [Streptomyces sp. NBC_01433]